LASQQLRRKSGCKACVASMGNVPSPLSRCCGPERGKMGEAANALAFNKVELAASQLFNLTLATAYHTSVLVNGEEFFFSDSGIFSDRAMNSHQGKPSERFTIGYSEKTGSQLLRALQQHFRPGTYDLLRKNCNSFSDCAVYFLLGRRLESRFCALEKLGHGNEALISQVTNGMYTPNKVAKEFQVDLVLAALDKLGGAEDKQAEVILESKSQPALLPGSRVTIVGLTSCAGLNGMGATVTRYNALNGRWEAQLHLSGQLKALRAEHLRPAGELVLETGDLVRVGGLKTDSGQALNGQEGKILRYLHEVSRYEVRFESTDTTRALKPESLQKIEALEVERHESPTKAEI